MIRFAAAAILAFSQLLSNDSAAQQYRSVQSTTMNAPGPLFTPAAVDAERLRLQTRLRDALAAFDEMLSTTDERGRADWRAYLDWEAWAQPILEAADFRIVEMRRVAHRLYAPHDGFEHANIRNLRAELADYLTFEAAIDAARGDLAGEYNRRIAQLSRTAITQPLNFAELEEAAWWLAVTRQASAELAALRAEFSQPSVILQVHRDLVEEKLNAFERTSHEQRDARQRIQGATVVGMANVSSHTVASLLDAPGEARLRVVTRGAVAAPHSVAFSGRVRVASSSTSQFTATADIYWNGDRFVAAVPQASADMHTRVKSIDAPLLLRRVAQRRVSASRGSAQAEAESNVERQAVESMAEHLDRAVDKLNDKSANFLNLIARTGDPAERWTTAVRSTSIEVAYMPRSYSGLAARPHSMPPLAGEETIGLSFHDSAIESLFRAQLAGKRWTDVDFAVMQRELTGANAHEHMIGLEPERWNVDWSWRRPLSIHFTPKCAAVRYRFDRVEVDGYESTMPFEVRADIRVSAPPLGLEMDLLAPASVASLDPDRPLPPHIQQFLERKFRGLFGERFSLDNLQFPAGGHLDGMSRFRVASARHDANWIHLRYVNRERNAPINRQGEAPAEPIASRRSSQPTFPVSAAR